MLVVFPYELAQMASIYLCTENTSTETVWEEETEKGKGEGVIV